MKIKSLLLGSAAALALSGGAYAADPAGMAEFVSLDVCDAYGISGLTIASDDTCLRIFGEVEYEFEISGNNDTGDFGTESTVEWELGFEATTQTDFGRAMAVIVLEGEDVNGDSDEVTFGDAYVSFGDTTVLMAGKKGTIFEVRDDQHIDLLAIGDDDVDDFVNTERGGHVIQVVSEVADGFSVSVGLEDLDNADDGGGTVGAAVGFAGAGVDANLGFVYGNIFGPDDTWTIYGDATANLDIASIYAGFAFNDDESWAALLTASAAFDMFSVRAGVGYEDEGVGGDDGFSIGAGVGFALTDTASLDLEVRYFDITEETNAELGVTVAVTETITAEAYVGGWFNAVPDDRYYVGAELAYAPGGGFETSLGFEVDTDENYELTFAASKSF